MKEGKVVKESFWELVNPEGFVEESRVGVWLQWRFSCCYFLFWSLTEGIEIGTAVFKF
jgi:hypothetical protein